MNDANKPGYGPRRGTTRNDPLGRCEPLGLVRHLSTEIVEPHNTFEIVQLSNRILQFFEYRHDWREIWMDGRALPDPAAVDPKWNGFSVGRWDGDALVVDSVAFDSRSWVDKFGYPHSEEMRLQERYRRVDADTLELVITITDPVVIEYELLMDDQRFFEARIVAVDADRLLTIVRDVTEAKRASELNRDLARRLIASQEIERQRLARELHDDVSQRLALLNLEIDRVAQNVDAEELRAQIRTLSAKVREVGRDLHDMSYKLHPSGLRVVGFVAALQSLCNEASQQRDLRVTFTHDAIPQSVDADVSLCLYRIVQEALHNVARHSHAREAQVCVTCDEGHIALRITDSGVGFDSSSAPQAGLGLVSMRERAAAMQGQFSIDAVPGGGTNIAVRIPLGSQATSATRPLQAST